MASFHGPPSPFPNPLIRHPFVASALSPAFLAARTLAWIAPSSTIPPPTTNRHLRGRQSVLLFSSTYPTLPSRNQVSSPAHSHRLQYWDRHTLLESFIDSSSSRRNQLPLPGYVIQPIMTDTVQEGDKVSWTWNGSHPSGIAAEIKPGDVTVTSHRGNDITKTGTKEDPAVHIERSGNDVVKTVSELKVEQKGASQKEDGTWDNSNGASATSKASPKKDEKQTQNGTNGEAKAGEKRKPEEPATKENEKPAAENGEHDAKKQKTTNGTAAPGGKKGPGRPKGTNGAKREKKAPRVGTAARKTRSQGNVE